MEDLIRAETDSVEAVLDALIQSHKKPYGLKSFLPYAYGPQTLAMKRTTIPLPVVEETQDKLVLYSKLVVFELEDIVIRYVRFHLLEAVAEKVAKYIEQKRRNNALALDSDSDSAESPVSLLEIMSDPAVADKRHRLENRIDALRKAAARL